MRYAFKGLPGVVAVAAGLALAAPQVAHAADELEAIKGTAYGDMAELLNKRFEAYKTASESEKADKQAELIRTIVRQNLTMIRMIDAIHDQVNGLIEANKANDVGVGRDFIKKGQTKFD